MLSFMQWIKKGLIFNPTNHNLDFDCTDYAQSPQTIVYEDFVRVYFSTRDKDKTNKFVSRVVFVDFNKDFTQIINHSKHEVIPLGDIGCFDEHGIFPFSPLRHENNMIAFICGWSRRISVPIETSTGLAVSEDNGLTFKKIGKGPVLTSSLREPMLVGDSFVRVYKDVFHMWYIYGKYWLDASGNEPEARVYKISHAISKDGITWFKRDGRQLIEDRIGVHECQALPTIIKINNKYHMFFCYRYATDFRKNPKRSYKLGYAYSEDLISWERDDEKKGIDVSKSGWDSEMMCYPHLFEAFGKIYLLYNGNEFGKFGFGLAELGSF
jgi:hypothetical protein